MHEPWFDPMHYSWIPGTALGVAGAVEGTLGGILAPKGKCKGLVLGFHFGVMAACLVLLVFGVAAYAGQQPYGVWYGLGFPGLLGLVIFGSVTPLLFRRYREAESGKSQAKVETRGI